MSAWCSLEEVSEPRRGQRFAFIMDTRLCDGAFALADGADMVVCESTFADAEAALAREYGHLTARQAGRIAAESGARLLVLTHFSQRYEHGDGQRLAAQAATAFGGQVVLATTWTGSRFLPTSPSHVADQQACVEASCREPGGLASLRW